MIKFPPVIIKALGVPILLYDCFLSSISFPHLPRLFAHTITLGHSDTLLCLRLWIWTMARQGRKNLISLLQDQKISRTLALQSRYLVAVPQLREPTFCIVLFSLKKSVNFLSQPQCHPYPNPYSVLFLCLLIQLWMVSFNLPSCSSSSPSLASLLNSNPGSLVKPNWIHLIPIETIYMKEAWL